MTVQVVKQKLGGGIGGSQAAAALGVSPYTSRLKLWLLLTGRAQDISSGNEATWGQILEPVVRGYYAARHGHDGKHSRIVVPTESLYHATIPWLRATPDGLVQEDIPTELGGGSYFSKNVEVKCPSWRTGWMWGHPKARIVPPHYRIQGVVEMAVTNLPRVDFAVLLGGHEYFEVQLERDAELEEMTIDGLTKFWQCVETDTPPEVDDADEWRKYFASLLPKDRVEIKAAPDVEILMDKWLAARRQAEEAEKTENRIRNELLLIAATNRANRIQTDHGPVSIRRSSAGTVYVVAPESWGQE